uniref:Uncharacterized protein n=1 Tax=Candidatus Kentrum sp. DK TaxID=2126562 RepID=A0A450RYD4_9GAMM|nr:MAG: hypothetical protein BECKDK2373B_GA0170837_100743 [Candidatus Kentron sp. DK]
MDELAHKYKVTKHVMTVYHDVFVRIMREKDGLDGNLIYLDGLLVAKAVGNVVKDMDRFAAFHLEDNNLPDRHKYAGFVAKWIAKEKPIQLKKTPPLNLTNEKLLGINAIFTVFVMASFLETRIPPEISRQLRYMFSFREEKGETLALIAYCCEQIAKAA